MAAEDFGKFLPLITTGVGGLVGGVAGGPPGVGAGMSVGGSLGGALQAGIALGEEPDVPVVPGEMRAAQAYQLDLADQYSQFTGASPQMTEQVHQSQRERGTSAQQIENTLARGDLDPLARERALRYVLSEMGRVGEEVQEDLLDVDVSAERTRLEGGTRSSDAASVTTARIMQHEMNRYQKIQEFETRQAELYGQVATAVGTAASEVGQYLDDRSNETEDEETTDDVSDRYDEVVIKEKETTDDVSDRYDEVIIDDEKDTIITDELSMYWA